MDATNVIIIGAVDTTNYINQAKIYANAYILVEFLGYPKILYTKYKTVS